MGSMYQKGDLQKSNTAKKTFTIRLKQEKKKIGKNVSETLQNRLEGVENWAEGENVLHSCDSQSGVSYSHSKI